MQCHSKTKSSHSIWVRPPIDFVLWHFYDHLRTSLLRHNWRNTALGTPEWVRYLLSGRTALICDGGEWYVRGNIPHLKFVCLSGHCVFFHSRGIMWWRVAREVLQTCPSSFLLLLSCCFLVVSELGHWGRNYIPVRSQPHAEVSIPLHSLRVFFQPSWLLAQPI